MLFLNALAKHIDNRHTRKITRPKLIDRNRSQRTSRNRIRPKWLLVIHPRLLPNEPQALRSTQIRLHQISVDDRKNLRTGVQMFRKSRHARVGIGSKRRIVLIEILQRQRVFAIDVVVKISHRHISLEATSARNESIVRMRGGHARRPCVVWDKPLARLPRKRRRVEQSQRSPINIRSGKSRPKRAIDHIRKASRIAIGIRKPNRHIDEVVPDLLIRNLQMLVRHKPKELVLNNRATK